MRAQMLQRELRIAAQEREAAALDVAAGVKGGAAGEKQGNIKNLK